MDTTIKNQWVTALRSGNYRQGKHALRNNDLFCCLGVLCDIMKDHKLIQGKWVPTGFLLMGAEAPQKGYPGAKIIDIADLNIVADRLTVMNDGGTSFDEIATYIEENL